MATLKTLNEMLEDTPTLLSFVEAPADLTDIDNAALKLAIIRRCGDVEPYYQSESDFMLFGTLWFQTHRFLFSHALNVWNANYNPIENYDRYENETAEGVASGTKQNTDTHSGTDTNRTTETHDKTDTHSGTDTDSTTINETDNTTHGGTDTDSTIINTTDNTTHGGTDSTVKETEIAGFNSADYSDSTKETTNTTHGETIAVATNGTNTSTLQHGETIAATKSGTNTTTVQHGETINSTKSGTNSTSLQHGEIITTDEDTSGTNTVEHGHIITSNGTNEEETTNTRESHIHGNIGVTTAQQMIIAELELANHFWLYDYIASAFESENFITAYNDYFGGY